MKIALIIERMDTARGGRETSTAQIAAELGARGHDVTILCQRGSWRHKGVTVTPLGTRGVLRGQRISAFIADAGQAATEGGFDIVHAMLPMPGADVYQPRGGTIPGVIAAHRRRWGWLAPVRKLAEPLNVCRATLGRMEAKLVEDPDVLCLAVSEMVAGEFREYYGRDENVRVVYNGVNVPDPDGETRADDRQRVRFKLGLQRDDVTFITLATNFELKGVQEAIAAFARWFHSQGGRRSGRLLVVGREQPEGYQRIAGMREIGSQVVFIPRTDNPFEFYAAADACVLLSWYDPCSRVVLEAVRWGIPAITTIFNGAAEILSEGGGIVVDSPKNARAVADAMDGLADPKQRARRSEACRAVADRLSVAQHVDGLLEAYASC